MAKHPGSTSIDDRSRSDRKLQGWALHQTLVDSLRDLPDDFFDSIRVEVHMVSRRAREVVLTGRSAAIPVVLVLVSELLLFDE